MRSTDNSIANSILTCLLIFLLSNILSSQALALTAEEEEMKVLRMYFKEDQLVISPTRSLKRLSMVAENMEIITAEDIERMNAHTLAEVLARVNGITFQSFGDDFGADSFIQLQGSTNKQVRVLLDGITWNGVNGGNPVLNTVPVKIIKRIEIIKGPASSAWGSSLGGVVNIVTKEAAKDAAGGTVSASYGEQDTYDLSAEAEAMAGPARLYLYAGRQESDGLWNERWFDNDMFYSKISLPLSSDIDFTFTAGYIEPHISTGDLLASDLNSNNMIREFFTTASIRTKLSSELTFDALGYYRKHRFVQNIDSLGLGRYGNEAVMFKDTVLNDKLNGFSGKIIFSNEDHTAVLGGDYSYGNTDQLVHAGEYQVNIWSAPETTAASAGVTKWALFANDTMSFGKLSVTPGVRHDYSSATGSFLSPSIGATYRAARSTILRASIAKGFNAPTILSSTSGGLFTDPNPELLHEKVWSYQAGLETWAKGYMKVKVNVFHHDIENDLDKIYYVGPAPTYNDQYFNREKSKRDGIEIDLETAPFYFFSLYSGYSFVHTRTYYEKGTFSDDAISTDTYSCLLALRYDDRRSLYAELNGRYQWWDIPGGSLKYDTFIFDLNMSKKLYASEKINNEAFLTVHNIFNGSHYLNVDKKNPRRWVEAGLRVKF